MGIYSQSVDLKFEVDYFFHKRVANIFGVDEILQDINKQDFRAVFLSDNAERLLFCISGDFAEKAFDRAHHLGLLQESLNTDASREEFGGTVLNYLTNRGNESGKYRQKYIDILNKIQVMQGDGPGVSAQPSFGLKGKAFQELTFDASPLPQQDGQPQEEGSMLTGDSLDENQRNLFNKVVEGMKLKYLSSLYTIFTSPDCSEDLKAVLSAKRDEDGNVFSILTYCFYEKNIDFNNFYHLIGLADKYPDAFRKLFQEESTIDGKSYTALSYAREQSSRLGTALEKMIEEKMHKLGLEVPAYEGQSPVNLGATPATASLIPQGSQNQQDRTGGFYSRETSIPSESLDDEDQSPAGPSDPDYASDYTSKKSPAFLDKLSANKGKIAVGTVGASLLIGGIITALVVANPIVVASAIAAAVLGAIMLVGALAKTTDKGEEILAKASDKLSGLFVSGREELFI